MMQVNSTDPQQQAMSQAMQFMPIMYIFIAFRMPAGLVLYWVASNVFTLVRQSFIYGWGSVLPAGALRLSPPLHRGLSEKSAQRPTVGASNGTNNGAVASSAVAAPNAPRKAKKRRKRSPP